MPGFNQKGPKGLGPGTGRQRGRCVRPDANLKTQPPITNNENSEKGPADDLSKGGLGAGHGRGGKGSRRKLGQQNRFQGGE